MRIEESLRDSGTKWEARVIRAQCAFDLRTARVSGALSFGNVDERRRKSYKSGNLYKRFPHETFIAVYHSLKISVGRGDHGLQSSRDL